MTYASWCFGQDDLLLPLSGLVRKLVGSFQSPSQAVTFSVQDFREANICIGALAKSGKFFNKTLLSLRNTFYVLLLLNLDFDGLVV